MHPYSKTYCLSDEWTLIRQFPGELPKACDRASYDYSSRSDVTAEVLQMLGNARTPINEAAAAGLERAARLGAARSHALEVGPVMAIAEEIPRAARADRARNHAIDIISVKLPDGFRNYPPFACFLIQTYLNILNTGTIETIGRELKALSADEALRRFFFLTEQVKVGQLIRARPEVPPRYQDALRDMEDKVKPSDESEVSITIERGLGWSPRSFRLDGCINAGSMGEVWRARHTGHPVPLALKVLTQTKLDRINSALDELRRVKEILGWYRDISREAVIAGEVAGKLIDLIEHEVDFRYDMENWQDWMGDKRINKRRLKEDGVVPLADGKFWCPMYFGAEERVLVMSLVDGVGLNDVMNRISGKPVGLDLAQDLWGLFRRSLFESKDGRYPMDLHPGNIMLLRREVGSLDAPCFNPTRVLVDTGQMGRIEVPGERANLVDFLAAAASDSPMPELLDRLERLGMDERGRECTDLRYDREGLGRRLVELRQGEDLLDGLGRLSVEAPMHGLRLPRYLDPLKAFVTLRGGIQKLAPDFVYS
jgi:hypothetical protein